MKNCPSCGKPYKYDSAKFCSYCGAERRPVCNPSDGKINRCTNTQCENYDAELDPEDCYCSLCGHITTFGQIIDSMT